MEYPTPQGKLIPVSHSASTSPSNASPALCGEACPALFEIERVRIGARGDRERLGRRLLSAAAVTRWRKRDLADREREVPVPVRVPESKHVIVLSTAQTP